MKFKVLVRFPLAFSRLIIYRALSQIAPIADVTHLTILNDNAGMHLVVSDMIGYLGIIIVHVL